MKPGRRGFWVERNITMLNSSQGTGSKTYTVLRKRARDFERKNGRRPRILLANMDRSTDGTRVKSFGVVYAEAGFDVDICPAFKAPEIVAKVAVENDVHVVGMVNSASGTNALPAALTQVLAGYGALDIRVMGMEPPGNSNPLNGEALAVAYAGQTLDLLEAS